MIHFVFFISVFFISIRKAKVLSYTHCSLSKRPYSAFLQFRIVERAISISNAVRIMHDRYLLPLPLMSSDVN